MPFTNRPGPEEATTAPAGLDQARLRADQLRRRRRTIWIGILVVLACLAISITLTLGNTQTNVSQIVRPPSGQGHLPSAVPHDRPGEIGTITTTGVTIPTSNSGPQSIASGPDGTVWFTELTSNKIGRLSPDGSMTEFPIPTPNASLEGIAVGPDGNLWFAEAGGPIDPAAGGAGKIGRITPTGAVTEFPLPTPNSFPLGVTAAPDGNVWFTESGAAANKIGRITPSGTVTEFPVPSSLQVG